MDEHNSSNTTIAAIATAAGQAGIGIVRISGPACLEIANAVCHLKPKPRYAHRAHFKDRQLRQIDEGIAIYFPAPASFTGEDVLELQGHGGPVVLDLLLRTVLEAGATMARPGEFSERAFHNGKIDLTQAEAIADLIAAGSERAARNAANALRGVFATRLDELKTQLIDIRANIEALLDFPDEELDERVYEDQRRALEIFLQALQSILKKAHDGVRIREGKRVVLAGLPNVGKSSLLNALAGQDRAIVSKTPGTTRDLLREHLEFEGLSLTLIDTAGLRDSGDDIEREGMRRAREQLEHADAVILVREDGKSLEQLEEEVKRSLPPETSLIEVFNKIDKTGTKASLENHDSNTRVFLSAANGEGVQLLQHALRLDTDTGQDASDEFSARRRHIDALENVRLSVEESMDALAGDASNHDLAAEHLRLAQLHLASITGDFSADDLLGEIFSGFCIGK